MACEEGLSKATVEAIADAAGISKRTFFNYFATKEDAILGTQPPTLSEEAIAAFRADGDQDLFGRTVHLMVAVIRSMFPEASQTERRRQLKAEYPELGRNAFSRTLRASEELVESILLERYDRTDCRNLTMVGAAARAVTGAMALLMMAGTACASRSPATPAAVTAGDSKAVDEAIEIFREAIKATL